MTTFCPCQTAARHVIDVTPWMNRATDATTSELNRDGSSRELLEQLSQTGWSIISMQRKEMPSNLIDSLGQEQSWTARIQELFSAQHIQQQSSMDSVTFRSSESGASGTSSIEPKWSWEMTTSAATENTETSFIPQQLSQWTLLLHSVAVTVRRALELPEGLLLQEDVSNNTSRHQCSDLLRVFYYHAVGDRAVLGSSPHTDWGSFTVVYQDAVGGLQTYCRTCQTWIDIPTNPVDLDLACFVVHVGDLTSLAIQVAQQQAIGQDDDNAATGAQEVLDDMLDIPFPSPLHRVLSPTCEPRVSLVYFAYPPAGRSIREIAHGIGTWIKPLPVSSTAGLVPYQEYYLLKNQSADATAEETESEAGRKQLGRILDQPVQAILQDKWSQVQRDS